MGDPRQCLIDDLIMDAKPLRAEKRENINFNFEINQSLMSHSKLTKLFEVLDVTYYIRHLYYSQCLQYIYSKASL